MSTGIQWTDETWNPVTGCTKVSPGCSRCYAEDVAKRFWKGRPFEDVRFHIDRIGQPLRWKKPRRVFVNSMSDLFHEDLTFGHIEQVFAVMIEAKQHTFQVLTKRPERMCAFMKHLKFFHRVPPNVWLGVSVENQRMADVRIPILLDTPAAVRFLSVEPLLSEIDLCRGGWSLLRRLRSPTGKRKPVAGVDWVIVGGESGRKARPCNVKWVLGIVGQCRNSGVPCFVKQLGAKPVYDGYPHGDPWLSIESPDGTRPLMLNDSKGGDVEEWPIALRVREFPQEQAHA